LKEELRLKDQEVDMIQRRFQDNEKERNLMELKEKSKLQKELETLEKNYIELEQNKKHENLTHNTEIERLQKEVATLKEEKAAMNSKINQMQLDLDKLQRNYESKCDRYDLLEKDFKQYQDGHRGMMNEEFKLKKDSSEMGLKMKLDGEQKVSNEYNSEAKTWKEEKMGMQNSLHQLMAENDKLRMDLNNKVGHYKHKYQDYKTKLKQANSNIQTLTTKVAHQEIQLQADRDDGFSDRRHNALGSQGAEHEYASAEHRQIQEAIRQLSDDPRR
jgi:chromosome segregation ATPase